jgi:archaellum component FlaC|tara:strand:- start:5642 stop:5872 length:231 start_codon:yes stop_codon:yes gene_type:complete
MKNTNELNLEVEKIRSNIELVKKDIETIKNNHLYHIEQDIRELNNSLIEIKKVTWTVALIIFTQLLMTIRLLLTGG